MTEYNTLYAISEEIKNLYFVKDEIQAKINELQEYYKFVETNQIRQMKEKDS